MKIDLHGYHSSDIVDTDVLAKIVQQAWEMGETHLYPIHGHGHARRLSYSPGFVNTNTGYFGLAIRTALRHNLNLRRWIKYTTLDCTDGGATSVKLKVNPTPTRTAPDPDLLPAKLFWR